MVVQPSGRITFLFTDIEGSTRRWERAERTMRVALARHDDLMRVAIERHHGHVFKTVGDAFCAAFPTAVDALQAALAAQRALLAEPWPAELDSLKARMALHTGEADERGGDYFGPTLNRVARLLSTAAGGQIVLSGQSYQELGGALPRDLRDVALRDLGQHRLRDLTDPVRIFQVVAPDLPQEFPPLRSLDSRPHNLPAQPNALIGREPELAHLAERLRYPETRLLTLTGPGGTGKTRLAVQLGAELLDDFTDGVYFVPLAALTDAALVLPTIARTLGVKETRGEDLIETLADHLSGKRLLLILDNFEQVLDAATAIADLLARCRQLAVVVTSRSVLRLQGEQEYQVPPLATPDPASAPSLEGVAAYPAVALFVARARAVAPRFALTPETTGPVAEICRRLDGLPLAIELAAARTKLLPPAALLERLGSRLKVLTGGPRDLPERQRTLRSTIAWSYDLLTPEEQTLFRRLAVFAGSWTFDAAEAVVGVGDQGLGVGGSGTPGTPVSHSSTPGPQPLAVDLLDGLASLTDKSLIRSEAGDGDADSAEPRFRMLETLREYGLEQLEASGGAESFRERHAQFFLRLAQAGSRGLTGPEQPAWIERLERERDNLREALAWSLDHAGAGPLGGELAGALYRFWDGRGYFAEGRGWLQRALDREPARTELRARLLNALGVLAMRQGDFAAARPLYDASRGIAEDIGDRRGISVALNNLGNIAANVGEYATAQARYTESLALERELGHTSGMALALLNLARIASDHGDFAAATAFNEQALALKRELGDTAGVALILNNLATVAMRDDAFTRAAALLDESLPLFRAAGNREGIAMALYNRADVAQNLGDDARAAACFAESLAIVHELGSKPGLVHLWQGIGKQAGRHGAAAGAARLFGAAEAIRTAIGLSLPPSEAEAREEREGAVRERLGAARYAALRDEGRALAIDAAVAEAQRLLEAIA